MPNHEEVLKRLAQPAEYTGAYFELDTALAFQLERFEVKFVSKTSTPTTDLEVSRDSDSYAIEVTSLNSSRAFEKMDRITTYASFQAFKQKQNLVRGGVVLKTPKSEEELGKIFQEIDTAILQAERTGYARMNRPGNAILYFAKPDLEHKIPDDCRNQFRFGNIASPDTEQKIIKKIDEKWKQLGEQDRPGFLIVNTGFIGVEEMDSIFSNSWDNIAIALSVYPKIACLCVSCPIGLLNAPKPYFEGGNKISFGCGVAKSEYRNFYFWKNKHADSQTSPHLFEAFRNYASNLKSLTPL